MFNSVFGFPSPFLSREIPKYSFSVIMPFFPPGSRIEKLPSTQFRKLCLFSFWFSPGCRNEKFPKSLFSGNYAFFGGFSSGFSPSFQTEKLPSPFFRRLVEPRNSQKDPKFPSSAITPFFSGFSRVVEPRNYQVPIFRKLRLLFCFRFSPAYQVPIFFFFTGRTDKITTREPPPPSYLLPNIMTESSVSKITVPVNVHRCNDWNSFPDHRAARCRPRRLYRRMRR